MECVFADTIDMIQTLEQQPPQPPMATKYSGFYTHDTKLTNRHKSTHIMIKNCDCVDECIRLKTGISSTRSNDKIGLLNMANDMCPGGGVVCGAQAQEEDICRRTTLYPTLHRELYPLNFDQVLYTPNVKIIKDGTYNRLLPNEWKKYNIDAVVSAAAIRRPTLNGNGTYRLTNDLNTMRLKIKMVLQTFAVHNIDHLILGAWGCGAFGNPAGQVAQLFHEALNNEFFNCFKSVTFAIREIPPYHLQLNSTFLIQFT
jgi:uncharacterized protein (TIGR02452 family)